MWQLYCLYECSYDTLYLMKLKSQVPSTLEDYVCEVGVLNIIYHGGAQEMQSGGWLALLCHYIIIDQLSKAQHQNQNLTDRIEGDMKLAFDKLFHETGADINYS